MKFNRLRWRLLAGGWLTASLALGLPGPGQAVPLRPECWTAARQQIRLFPAVRALRPVLVDAALEEWQGTPFLPLGLIQQTDFRENWGGRDDLSAKIFVRWDDWYLYLAAEVSDANVLTEDQDRRRNDAVEWSLRPLNLPGGGGIHSLHVLTLPTGEVLDGDTGQPLAGAEAAGRTVPGGYHLEGRLPWSVVRQVVSGAPAPVTEHPRVPLPSEHAPFDFAVQVNDFDEAAKRKGDIAWRRPDYPPEKPGAEAEGPARLPPPQRLELVSEIAPSQWASYLPALIVVGTERDYVLAGEEATLVALVGLPPALQAVRLELELIPSEGEPMGPRTGERWAAGLFQGHRWLWRMPDPFDQASLLVATFQHPRVEPHAIFGLARSAGDAFRVQQNRLAGFRQVLEGLEKDPPPDIATAVRWHGPSLRMELDRLASRYEHLPTWSIRSALTTFAEDLDQFASNLAELQQGRDPLAHKRGTFMKAYRSEIDDTLQPYSIYVPEEYGVAPPPRPPEPITYPTPPYYDEPFTYPQTPYGPDYGGRYGPGAYDDGTGRWHDWRWPPGGPGGSSPGGGGTPGTPPPSLAPRPGNPNPGPGDPATPPLSPPYEGGARGGVPPSAGGTGKGTDAGATPGPTEPEPAKDTPWPLLVSLHGYGGGWSPSAPAHPGFIGVAPHGRGNGDYRLWCQMDVLQVIEEVKRDYRIDENRVYLTGGSMGGTGTWFMAVHYPDLFAAIAPICGNTDHHVWEKEWGWGQKTRSHLTELREYIEDIEDSSFFAENLRHVPSYCIHGDADDIVPVGHSRVMIDRLAELGYEHKYDERKGVGHSVSGTEKILPWLWDHRRDPFPRQVTFKTAKLRHKGAYWVEILRFAELLRPALIQAEVVGDNEIKVTLDNVARYALKLNEHLVDLAKPVRIFTHEALTYEGLVPEDGRIVLALNAEGKWQPDSPPPEKEGMGGMTNPREERESGPVARRGNLFAPGAVGGNPFSPGASPGGCAAPSSPGVRFPPEKNSTVEGPIEHAFMSRFLLVYGTQGEDPREKDTNFRMADEFAEKWKRWANARARLKSDEEVTEQDLQDSNLILYGGPKSNKITAQINDYLPIRFDGEAIVMGDRRYEGPDVGMKVCYPSPFNPQRYVCVFAGVTWRATYGINGRFGNWFDWGIFDDRNWFDFGIFDARTQDPETWLAVGFFDQDWQLQHRYTFFGDESRRAAVVPWRPPERVAADFQGQEIAYLSDLIPQAVRQEKGTVGLDRTFSGEPLELGGQVFERGLGVHPHAELVYDLGGHFRTFETYVGAALDPDGEKSGQARPEADKVEYEIYGDGRLLARTGTMGLHDKPRHLYVSVEGVKELKLVAASRDGRKWLFGDANWGLTRLEGRTQAHVQAPFEGGFEELSLNGEWLLESFDVGVGAQYEVYQDSPYLPTGQRVRVPGTVQAALMAAGQLPDLYRDKGLEKARAVEKKEWWHYRRFRVPQSWRGRGVQLRFEGVNYQADVWLNGHSLGTVVGMFKPGVFEVARWLNYDAENFLAVRVVAAPAAWTFHPDGFELLPRDQALMGAFCYGLGHAPQLIPLGLWRPVTLRATGPLRLAPPGVTTTLTLPAEADAQPAARLTVRTDVSSVTEEKLAAVLVGTLRGATFEMEPIRFELPVALEPRQQETVEAQIEVPEPRLWFPQGLGDQPLYQLELALQLPSGLVSDRVATSFGLREVKLNGTASVPYGREATSASTDYETRLYVNGVPVPVRGALWRPADALLRLEEVPYDHFLRLALEAGLNTLRVWGGGMPETDRFYDLCDRLGLLVIQEFPLVDGNYDHLPADGFAQAAEATLVRLRNHPSLIAWVGGSGLDLKIEANRQLIQKLADLIAHHDPGRLFQETGATQGQEHFWFAQEPLETPDQVAWNAVTFEHGEPFTAPPPWSDLQRFIDDQGLWPLSDVWPFHGSRPEDQALAVADFGPSEEGRDLVRKMQLAQAARYQHTVERFRAHQPSTVNRQPSTVNRQPSTVNRQPSTVTTLQPTGPGGFFLWAFNDTWPSISPSLVDWYGRPKPSYYAVRRALDPLVVLAVLPKTQWLAGEELTAEIYARADNAAVATARLLKTDRTLVHEAKFEVQAAGESVDFHVGTFRYSIPPYQGDTLWLLELTLAAPPAQPGEPEPPPVTLRQNLYWLSVTHQQTAPATWKILWIGDVPPALQPLFAHLRRNGVEVVPAAAAPRDEQDHLKLDGYAVIVVRPEPEVGIAPEPLSATDLVSLADAVRQGTGLLFDGPSRLMDQAPLDQAAPVYLPQTEVARGEFELTFPAEGHPVLAGLDPRRMPRASEAGSWDKKASATVLAQLGQGQPLLIEGALGKGRVLAFLPTPAYRAQLLAWEGRQRLYAGMLGYLAKLPHAAFQSLIQAPTLHAFGDLAALPPVKPELTVEPTSVTVTPGTEQALRLTVKNPTDHLILMTDLELQGVPDPLRTYFSDNDFPLWPKQTHAVDVTFTLPQRASGTHKIKAVVGGWNVEKAEVEVEVNMALE